MHIYKILQHLTTKPTKQFVGEHIKSRTHVQGVPNWHFGALSMSSSPISHGTQLRNLSKNNTRTCSLGQVLCRICDCWYSSVCRREPAPSVPAPRPRSPPRCRIRAATATVCCALRNGTGGVVAFRQILFGPFGNVANTYERIADWAVHWAVRSADADS